MRDTLELPGPSPRRLDGRHVLFMLLAFFGVVFAVNAYFLVSAISSHTGVVAIEPYRKGLAYNERIAAGERQAALGWTETVTIRRDGTVTASIVSSNGAAVGGLVVNGRIGRPSTASHDQPLIFTERSPGQYIATASPIADGAWLVTAEARVAGSAADPVYRTRRRLWLKP